MSRIVESTETNVPIGTTLFKYDLVTGATVVAAIQDPYTGDWLGNFATGAWQSTKATVTLSEDPEQPGHYRGTANVSQTPASSHHINVFYEVTAGGSGVDTERLTLVTEAYDIANGTDQSAILTDTGTTLPGTLSSISAAVAAKAEPGDAMGLTGAAVDSIHREQIADHSGVGGSMAEALANVEASSPPSAVAIASQVDSTLSATHGVGNWEGGGAAPTVADIWQAVLTDYPGAGNAAETLLGAGGAFTPSQVADAVLNALTNDYQLEGSIGKAIGDMDATTLRLLLEAAVGKLTRLGYAYTSMPVQSLFVGDVGVTFRLPILIDGQLADLTGATVSWRFVDPSDGSTVTLPGVVSATPGHVEYVTSNGDGVIDTAGQWRAQANATLPDSSVKYTEIMLVDVQAVV